MPRDASMMTPGLASTPPDATGSDDFLHMLRLIDVSIARGTRTLYRGVSLIARPGERVGLVGANGCGKSRLFAAVQGELGLEAGSIEAPRP